MSKFVKELMAKIVSFMLVACLITVSASSAANARYISPDTMDPTIPGVGTNRYAYSENDPINKSDPNGHIAEVIGNPGFWGGVAEFFGGLAAGPAAIGLGIGAAAAYAVYGSPAGETEADLAEHRARTSSNVSISEMSNGKDGKDKKGSNSISSSNTGTPDPDDNRNKKDEKNDVKEKSPNQLNKEIIQGKAPKGIDRVDIGKIKGEQTHAHFENGSALNKDGTWKHGEMDLTNAQKDWLGSNGWGLPE